MKQDWKTKTIDEIYDHFESLSASEGFDFLIYLMQNFPELEVNWVDLILDAEEILILEENPEKIEKFIEVFSTTFPQKYEKEYEYIEPRLISYYLFKGNIEKVRERLEIVKANPANGIDLATMKAHHQLLYYGYYDELLDFSKTVWKPIAESDIIWGYPHYTFCTTIYLHELEKAYIKIKDGQAINWTAFLNEMEKYDIDEEEETFNIVSHCLENEFEKNTIVEFIENKKHREANLSMNIHFMKYMKEEFDVSFMLSDRLWNMLSGKKIFSKKKNIESYFYIPFEKLDKHFADHFDAMYRSNEIEMFGKSWGLEYVYHFIKDKQLIDDYHYNLMVENIHALKYLFLKIVRENLWEMSFVFNWPELYKPDYELKKLFKSSFTNDTELFKDYFNNYCKVFEMTAPDRLKNDIKSEYKNDIIFENSEAFEEFFDHFSNENVQSTFVKEFPDIGRNDPCPCGSGKKYKKCCMNKNEDME